MTCYVIGIYFAGEHADTMQYGHRCTRLSAAQRILMVPDYLDLVIAISHKGAIL